MTSFNKRLERDDIKEQRQEWHRVNTMKRRPLIQRIRHMPRHYMSMYRLYRKNESRTRASVRALRWAWFILTAKAGY